MKRLFLSVIALSLLGCRDQRVLQPLLALPRPGTVVPPFEYSTPNGDRVQSTALGPTPTVLFLWSTHCPTSRHALTAFRELLRDYADRPVRIVLLSDDKSDSELALMPTVLADETQLAQVFQNLISNAIKFRGTEPPRIHVGARPENGKWLFSVSDNGIGIDGKFFERVFVIFQRLHTREQYDGTGMGLAICKKIVERHGGRIWVESKPGGGSVFHFTDRKSVV